MKTLAVVMLACFATLAGASLTVRSQDQASTHVSGMGVVTAIDVAARRIKINHQEIKGFMAAMEMEYPVPDASSFRSIKRGDTVEFIIRRRNGMIERLKVTKPAAG